MLLTDIIEGLTGYKIDAPHAVSQVVIDSRQAGEGFVFVALPGEHTDGHDYVAAAFQQGAIAAITHQPVAVSAEYQVIKAGLANPPTQLEALPICIQVENSLAGLQQLARFWRQKFNPRVIGLTGSVGKSTTKELVAAVLAQRYRVLKSVGNLNNEIGLPLTLLQLTAAHEVVVLEMGMYEVGEIELLCHIAQPHIGIITNVGPTHLERLGTIERIAQAKAELVQALPADGTAILNHDDPLVLAMAAQTKAHVLTYGLTPDADLFASQVTNIALEGITFALNYEKNIMDIRLPMLGQHHVYAALPAALVGVIEGVTWAEIIQGLQSATPLRLVAQPGPQQSVLLDDTYNASPASTLAALNLLANVTAPRKIAVLGDMMELGSYEEMGHRQVGARAAAVVDLLITLGSRAQWIAAEAKANGLSSAQILQFDNHEAIIDYLHSHLSPQEVVLIKGSRSLQLDKVVAGLLNGVTPH